MRQLMNLAYFVGRARSYVDKRRGDQDA
jgi:hypothetical protein